MSRSISISSLLLGILLISLFVMSPAYGNPAKQKGGRGADDAKAPPPPAGAKPPAGGGGGGGKEGEAPVPEKERMFDTNSVES